MDNVNEKTTISNSLAEEKNDTYELAKMRTSLNMLESDFDKLSAALLSFMNDEIRSDFKSGAVKLDQATLRELRDMQNQLAQMKQKMEMLDEIESRLDLLEDLDEELHGIREQLNKNLNVDFNAMYHNILEQMNVEAIKVYRNIQAVIVEEQSKQNNVLFGVDGKSDKLKNRMSHVMIFSIVSFVVSILVMIVNILPFFGIKLF